MNDNDNPPRGRRWKLGLALLLLLLGVGWYCWPDGRVNTAKRLRDELTGEKGKALSPDQRQEKWRQYRQAMEKMTPAQREVLRAEDRKRQAAEMGKYFRLSPAEKTRHLDERIKRMTQMSQNRPAGQGGTNRGPAGAGQASRGSAGVSPSTGGRTPAARDGRRQDRLDGSSPAQRAMFAQYMSDLNARRRQLGLPTGGPRR